ncbi:MAG TPA: hypothetical protein VN710_11200 [Verrucomicrobiae bacterium]|jgi:hypothetical protein|nr:hypothetical protein [Verrucomicrobiae bacterium]
MDKYTAGKIEGMLIAVRHSIEFVIADDLRKATPPEKLRNRMLKLGRALAELIDLSRELYDEHPELNPHLEAEREAAEFRRSKASSPSNEQ